MPRSMERPAPQQRRRSALDGPAARIAAALVLAAVLAALLVMHWDDLFPPDPVELAGDDPVAPCIGERTAEVEAMISDNPAMAGRREMMLASLPALCADLVGEGSGGGAPPPR